jgi:hypothetical protein
MGYRYRVGRTKFNTQVKLFLESENNNKYYQRGLRSYSRKVIKRNTMKLRV